MNAGTYHRVAQKTFSIFILSFPYTMCYPVQGI